MDQQQPATGTSLVKKLSDVMGQIGRIPKNGKNEHFGYQYVMESDLVEAVRDRLAEKHVFISSSVKGVEVIELTKLTKQGGVIPMKVGILHLEYVIRDGDSGETITLNGVGEIDQDGGKGLYKAMTGALKYALMKTFLIPTGDDPERDDASKRQPAREPVGDQPKPVPSAPKQTAQQSGPTRKEEPKAPDAATAAQVQCIKKLAAQICLDVENDLYRPRGIAQQPTKAQASAIITSLKAKLAAMPPRTKKPAAVEVTQAERQGMKAA